MVTRQAGGRRGRPRNWLERGNPETRALLLDAAERLLTDKGISDITVGAITGEAGLALGTFYIYFKDRYGILQALVQRRTERIFHEAHDQIPRELGTLERITFSISKIVQSWQQYRGVLRSLYQLSVQREDFLALQREFHQPFTRHMCAELEASITRGHARPIDARIAVDALATMLSGCCMNWFGLGLAPYPGATVEGMASQLALLWYRALFGRDPAEATQGAPPPATPRDAPPAGVLGASSLKPNPG